MASAAGRPPPNPRLLRRVDALARAILPATLTAVLMVVAAAPVGIPGMVAAVALPCVFFWSVFRPGGMPPPVVFGLGLLADLLTAQPIGSGLLPLLVLHGLAVRWRFFFSRQAFLTVWLIFAGLAAGAAGLGFLLDSLLSWRLRPLASGMALAGLASGLYPPLAWPLARLHGAMRRAENAP